MNTSGKSALVSRITILIIVIAFIYALANSLAGILLNRIIDAFSITGARQGLTVSMINIGTITAVICAPLFQGRVRKLLALMMSSLLIAVALALCGAAATETMFYVVSIFFGLGCGWLDGYINSILIDLHPDDSAVPMGLLHGFFGIGSLAMPLIGTALLSVMVWRGLYYITAICMLALTILILLAARRAGAEGLESELHEERVKLSDLGGFLRDGRNELLLLFGFCAGCIQTGISSWMVRYMTLEFGNEALGAKCLSVLWIFSTINRFLCPRIKLRPMRLLIFGGLFSGISLIVGVACHSAAAMLIASAAVGLFSGHFIPMLFIEGARNHRGSTTLTTFVMSIAISAGRIVIPILVAAAANHVGNGVGMALPALAGFIGAVSGILALRSEKNNSFE